MRRHTLKRIATEVWGKGWAFELARLLGRHPVTIRRWQAGLTTMSRPDHMAILKIILAASKERHKHVREMVAHVRNPVGSDTYRQQRRRRVKDPIPPWKKSAQHLATQLETLPEF